jgi:hypothetical protein
LVVGLDWVKSCDEYPISPSSFASDAGSLAAGLLFLEALGVFSLDGFLGLAEFAAEACAAFLALKNDQ